MVSSRTPEGQPNRCAVCGHRCKVEPSSLSPDAPCPSCGHLLWFPADAATRRAPRQALAARPKRPQNPPTPREPQVQAQRLVRRLVRRAEGLLGRPEAAVTAELAGVRGPRQAERLLSLLYLARSWSDLLAAWRAEQDRQSQERQTARA
jgi:hypothetical protein